MAINPKIRNWVKGELKRQQKHIELIASENFVSPDILQLTGSVLTNKYAEGYPEKRYYGGCEHIDKIEQLAIDTLKTIFQVDHANVQPHSGSSANLAVYDASGLQAGDTVLGMDLAAGGHLTHGHKLNFSGKKFNCIGYGVDPTTEKIDYQQVRTLAIKHKPKLIIAGASTYSQEIDFARFAQIAQEVGALLWADIAHIAGLIAAGLHQNPAPYADFISSTTHKTLRGPRGGIIMAKAQFAQAVDRAIFPGNQGGPLEHVIAAKAQCFLDVLKPSFTNYAKQVIANAQAMAQEFKNQGVRVISGGTTNHMLMIDVKSAFGLSGRNASQVLGKINITVNKNMIPFDQEKPMVTSGIRLGSPAMTTRKMKEEQFVTITKIICEALTHSQDPKLLQKLKKEVLVLTSQFPLYQDL